MRRWLHIACLLLLTASSSALADLTFPALFEVVEKEPGLFQLTLTVPLVKGRYMKAKPIVPDAFRPQGDPEATAGTASLTRSWQVKAKPESLHGEAFGLEGLLGTSREVRFLLTTLDGRRHETVLRSTRSIFFVPQSADGGRLAATAAQDGLRRTVRDVGMWSVLACVLFSGMSIRMRTWITVAVTAAFLGCWAMLIVLPRAGLSDAEVRLMSSCLFAGSTAGVAGAVAALGLLRSLVPGGLRRRLCIFTAVLAVAWVFYEGAGLAVLHGPAWLVWMQGVAQSVAYRWFSPFAADWAMAKLRVPLFSIAALVLIVLSLIKIRHTHVRITVSGFLFIMTFVLLPYGATRASVSFLSPGAPSPQQARRIIEPMLSEIYHALNLTDEGQTYDQLAEQVSGDLVPDLYLDSRRRLVAGARQGASVAVKQVKVQAVGTPRISEAEAPAYPCRWTVTAKVTHWQHSHERRNMYQGDLSLIVEDNRWKLAALNLRSEEREVVPGSFSSR